MQEFVVRGEYITLGQLVKAVNEVGSGGEVKDYLANNSPLVNGEPENRRGRKLRAGDVIAFKGAGEIHCIAEG